LSAETDINDDAAATAARPSPAGGIIRAARRPPGWQATGPAPDCPTDAAALAPLWPRENEDLCWLAGNWRILQRTDGHRFSLDDLVTAFTASELLRDRPPARYLDLGCGIGSVLLFVSWRFPAAVATGIEAQALSADLARRSIAWNGLHGRVRVIEGDFRAPEIRGGLGPFDLITGTPPYFPIGTGLQSPEVQRGPCRFEHRGGVEAYCETAAPLLAPGAPLVLCAAPGQIARLEAFAPAVDLAIEGRCDVVPRAGKAPLFSVFVLRARAQAAVFTHAPPLVVRDQTGARTAEFRAVRAAMGMPM
jgi:tRNA1Val (adenine37-N6)-methyltransferase